MNRLAKAQERHLVIWFVCSGVWLVTGDESEYLRVKEVIGNSLSFLVKQKYKESDIEMFCTFAEDILKEDKFPKVT